jgi:hypothetical protein
MQQNWKLAPKEEGVTVKEDTLVFSSGTTVMLKHVTSVSIESWKNIPFLVTCLTIGLGSLAIGFPALQIGASELAPVAILLGLFFICASFFAPTNHFVGVASSSGQGWIIPRESETEAATLRDKLQQEILTKRKPEEGIVKEIPQSSVTTSDELIKLKQLLDQGVLSPDEFAAAKAKVLK